MAVFSNISSVCLALFSGVSSALTEALLAVVCVRVNSGNFSQFNDSLADSDACMTDKIMYDVYELELQWHAALVCSNSTCEAHICMTLRLLTHCA